MYPKDNMDWLNKGKVGYLDSLSSIDNNQVTDYYLLFKKTKENYPINTKPRWQVEADAGSFRNGNIFTSRHSELSDSNWFFDNSFSFSLLEHCVTFLKYLLFFVFFLLLYLFFRYLNFFLLSLSQSFGFVLVLCNFFVFILFICFFYVCYILYVFLFLNNSIPLIILDESFLGCVLESTRSIWNVDVEHTNYYCNDLFLSGSIYDCNTTSNTDSYSIRNLYVEDNIGLQDSDILFFEREYYLDSCNRSVCFNLLLDLYGKEDIGLHLCGEYKDIFIREKYFPFCVSYSNQHLFLNRLVELGGQFLPSLTHRSILLNMNSDSRFLLFNTFCQLSKYQCNIYSTILYKYSMYSFFTSSTYIDMCHSSSVSNLVFLSSFFEELFFLINKLNMGSTYCCVSPCLTNYNGLSSRFLLPYIGIDFTNLSTFSNLYLSKHLEVYNDVSLCSSFSRSYFHRCMFNLPLIHDYYKVCYFGVSNISLEDFSLPIYRIALSNYKDVFPIVYSSMKYLSSTTFSSYLKFIFDNNTWLGQLDLRMLLRSSSFVDSMLHQDARHHYLFLNYYKYLLLQLNRDIIIGPQFFYPVEYYDIITHFLSNTRSDILELFPSNKLYPMILSSSGEYQYFFFDYSNQLYTGRSYNYYHNYLSRHFLESLCSVGLDKFYYVTY